MKTTAYLMCLKRGFLRSEVSLYTDRYFFRLVICLQHFHIDVGRAFMYTPVGCHFSNFYMVGDIVYRQKLLFFISLVVVI